MKKLIELNTGVRVLEFLKENVKINLISPEKAQAEFNETEMIYEIKPVHTDESKKETP